jgi:fluoride exporter
VKPTVIVAVAVGGAVGTLARVSVDLFFSQDSWNDVVSILVVNVVGAFLLGLALGHGMAEQPLWVRQGLFVGVLGSFTTMSGIALVTLNLPLPVGVVYLGATFVLGVSAAALGWLLGQRMRPQGVAA